jgi:uncharacterized glyoxalase superfamily protein PhnB
MQMNPYLSFNGQCEAAFKFYEQCFGGQLGPIFRHAGTPMADQAPADWQDKVMHGSLTVGGQVLMGGDVAPDRYEEPKGFWPGTVELRCRSRRRSGPSVLAWSSIGSGSHGSSTAKDPISPLADILVQSC